MALEILVTNDDGYTAKGIKTIVSLLSKYGNITVVAPKEGQSGKSAALTLDKPIRLIEISKTTEDNGNSINTYAVTGTPADCVKLAMNKFFNERKPDLLISGINHGCNVSVGSVYSGTLGACAEGTIYGIPSIGFSLDTSNIDADFSIVENNFNTIITNYLKHPANPGVFLNINFPYNTSNTSKGIKFSPQGTGRWIKEFNERTDPHGQNYYWMTGEFIDEETRETGDHKLLAQGYITIVPHKVDNTDYNQINELSQKWGL